METNVDLQVQDVKPTGLYSIYDTVAKSFSPPFVADSNEVAIRQYGILLTDMPKHIRQDYVLSKLGTFEYHSATFDLLPKPDVLVQGDGAPYVK